MDLTILKKKLSTFRTQRGRLTSVSDDLLVEILLAWEQWTGPASGFYAALGADHRKMASLIGRAKRLKREGHFPADGFKAVHVLDAPAGGSSSPCGIELQWEQGRVIRFSQVDQLIDFLRRQEKAA